MGEGYGLQRLNLRNPKPFDYSDEIPTVNMRRQFFCVSEGATEESYFWGVKNNKKDLEIKNHVVIEIVEKEKGQESYSHPLQLVNACLVSMGRIDEEGNEIPEEKWDENCKWDYDAQVDVVCVIFDRDYRGLEEHLDKIFELCRKHNIYVAISNPNFELWLLMHFPNIEQYDKEELLCNAKNLRGQISPDASKNKKYLEILLSNVSGGYTKGCGIQFEKYKDNISLALKQVKMFEQNPEHLQTQLGSAVGVLIEKIKSTEVIVAN